ncbi:MAG: hypothetical protein Q8M66_00820 [Actinomycetota bacterium]|nr:hypothetical protein [Actinomycetota bacterium]
MTAGKDGARVHLGSRLVAHCMRVGPAPGIRPFARAPHVIALDPSAASLLLGTPVPFPGPPLMTPHSSR